MVMAINHREHMPWPGRLLVRHATLWENDRGSTPCYLEQQRLAAGRLVQQPTTDHGVDGSAGPIRLSGADGESQLGLDDSTPFECPPQGQLVGVFEVAPDR